MPDGLPTLSPAEGPDTTRALTHALSRGDRAALASFYTDWFPRCYALARALTHRDESFCLDVVQDAMLRVIRSIKPIASRPELEAWMTTVVRSAALDLLRGESRRAARERARPPAPSIADWTDGIEARELVSWTLAQVARLPEGDRELFDLRFTRSRTLPQAAAATGTTTGAAHGRLRRLVAGLRHSLVLFVLVTIWSSL